MGEVFDLAAERARREPPEEPCVCEDGKGGTLYMFSLEFDHDGRRVCSEIWAYSWEDAEARVAAMRQSLVVSGQIFCQAPGRSG